ncbi:hypothetical protein LCGC14_2149270 [marine sediment metagenome]|uniref:C3H1-type domain-containing protein n=2 Tax=root TaxID=1 RepID=A0A0F9DW77_9ZZZZ|nr:MAG: hypothetical protein LCMAC202_00990 [Marseillevirus LCMAC202]
MADKIQKPCYFYNTGGCYHSDGAVKSEAKCKYLHVKVNEPLEKPQHLKAPCKYYHLRGHCKNSYCVFGHSELSAERWEKYFPTHNYPGMEYTRTGRFNWDGKQPLTEPQMPPSGTNVNQVKTTILMMMLQMLDELSNE